MAFDRESLMPLYRLEIGEAGESCALHIAERLGMPEHILNRARAITYATPETTGACHSTPHARHSGLDPESSCSGLQTKSTTSCTNETCPTVFSLKIAGQARNDSDCGTENAGSNALTTSSIISVTPLPTTPEPEPPPPPRSQRFNIGDSVIVHPKKDLAIVYQRANDKGEVGVQVKGEKFTVNHKRLQLKVAATELYPDDYDFSIIFDTVENRKARHLMGRKHVVGNKVVIKDA